MKGHLKEEQTGEEKKEREEEMEGWRGGEEWERGKGGEERERGKDAAAEVKDHSLVILTPQQVSDHVSCAQA